MCYNCFLEYGQPQPITDKILTGTRLINQLYRTGGGEVGGYAHIVVDDWNLDDGFVEACLADAKAGVYNLPEEVRKASIECLEYLLTLTQDERATALAIQEGHIPMPEFSY